MAIRKLSTSSIRNNVWYRSMNAGNTAAIPLTGNFLVIAGGGGGGSPGASYCGGGGAGGFRTSAGPSGGGASAESSLALFTQTTYTVTVGAGGADNAQGSPSIFSTISTTGGGAGAANVGQDGGNGGSGGGGNRVSRPGGTAVSGQGFIGGFGSAANGSSDSGAGGGGGAGGVGQHTTNNAFTNEPAGGGLGLQSSITGTSVWYAEGGSGTGFYNRGAYNQDIGGNIATHVNGNANTGSGGGGGKSGGQGPTGYGGSGGSGVVIISYPNTFEVTGGAGLTFTTSSAGQNRVTRFTAGTGTIQFAPVAPPAGSYHLLETVSLTSNQASVEFTNLVTKYASTYQHLQIRAVMRGTNSGQPWDTLRMTFNGDTAANYSFHNMVGNGNSVAAGGAVSQSVIQFDGFTGASAASGAFGSTVIDILDPFETTKNKTLKAITGRTADVQVGLHSGQWMSTAAISSIALTSFSGTMVAGTRFSIYGIRGS